MPKTLTIKEARLELFQLGVALKKNSYGEFEIKPVGCLDAAQVYHTDELQDALDTGRDIANGLKRDKFKALQVAADVHYGTTGDMNPFHAVTNALTNANDTFKWDESNPDYWRCALDSIQGSIDANGWDLYPWFKQHGHAI